MINKEEISTQNFSEMRAQAARLREDRERQDEALADTRLLREFALTNNMNDAVVELFLEEALIHQHNVMEDKNDGAAEKMRLAVESAKKFIDDRGLTQWQSRIARFMGRVADYQGRYDEAIEQYQKAIDTVTQDPRYVDNRALAFEYKGFKVLDRVRLGEVEEGLAEAEKLYQDYESSDEGRELKENDYTTWAIWRSGVLINLSRALIDLGKKDEYKDRIEFWLSSAMSDLQPAEGVKVWADFGFRKNEIEKVRQSL